MFILIKAGIAKYLKWRFYNWSRERLEQHQQKQFNILVRRLVDLESDAAVVDAETASIFSW